MVVLAGLKKLEFCKSNKGLTNNSIKCKTLAIGIMLYYILSLSLI